MTVETHSIQNSGGLRPEYKTYNRQKCFVGHSHHAKWSEDILAACTEVLPKFGLEPWYAADHFDPTKPLRGKVVQLIANARYGIYDLSSWQDGNGQWHLPRNVLIELGIAIALNRPVLLLRHTSNKKQPLPAYLQGLAPLEFTGSYTLKKALEKHLPQWFNVPPDREWLNRFCLFGNQVCDFREKHPRGHAWGQQTINCHIADGLNPDDPSFQIAEREEIRGAFEDLFTRYSDLSFDYLDELSLTNGYQFRLCSHCQAVRSTPFAIYRILPDTPAEVFITIGMSIALETLFAYDIPKILLVRHEQELPSLLRGYEVVEAVNSSQVKKKLKAFIPSVMQQTRAMGWKPRPLPFVEITFEQEAIPEYVGEKRVKDSDFVQLLLQATKEATQEIRFLEIVKRIDWDQERLSLPLISATQEASERGVNVKIVYVVVGDQPLPSPLGDASSLSRGGRRGIQGKLVRVQEAISENTFSIYDTKEAYKIVDSQLGNTTFERVTAISAIMALKDRFEYWWNYDDKA